MKAVIFSICTFIVLSGCRENDKKETDDDLPVVKSVPLISYQVKSIFPHDTSLFTEGFVIHEGKLFESTGSPSDLPQAKSMIGISDLVSGKFEKKIEIDGKKYFGEGIVFLNGKLFQLTYENQLGFIYDARTFRQTGTFTYRNKEGWSLTTDGKYIIMSDGTETITFLDPVKLQPVKTLRVTENDQPLRNVNELEFINGYIYANVWQTSQIIKIDTSTGKIMGKLDLSALTDEVKRKTLNADVLNGIAYDSASNKVYVTGKLWPNIYEISFAF